MLQVLAKMVSTWITSPMPIQSLHFLSDIISQQEKKLKSLRQNGMSCTATIVKIEKYRVIGINEDGKNSLKITDNQSGKDVEFPEITDGDIMAVNISDSEKWMRLTVGTSKAPNNIYVYNFETKVLKKLSESLNPEISGDDLVGAEVVRYKSFDGLEIPAIYYKPHNASPNTKVPALVWVHG